MDAFCPDFDGLAHGDPDVGVDDVHVLRRFHGVGDELHGTAGLLADLLTGLHELVRREVPLCRSAGHEVEAHLGATDHEGVAHVVARIAHVDEVDAFEVAEVFLDGQEVREDLGRVVLVGETVPDRDARILREFFDDLLAVAAVLDALEHAGQHAGRVGDALLLPDLRVGRVQVRAPHAEVVGSHFKAAAGPGAGLFEDEGDVLALAVPVRDAGLFLGLQVRGEVDEIADLFRCEVQQFQKVSTL